MDIFISDFQTIDYLPDVSNMYVDRFLLFDDQRTSEEDYGPTIFTDNVRHNFTLESSVEQVVYITVYVHHARSYPNVEACSVKYPWEFQKNALVVEGQSKTVTFADGQGTIEFEMLAGQTVNFYVELAWDTQGVTKDFGIASWGTSG